MRHPAPLLTVAVLVLGGCLYPKGDSDDEPCSGTDTAEADWMIVLIDHQEQAGEYTYEFQADGLNTCAFTAPLGSAEPACSLQGGAVTVQTDEQGITSIKATAQTYDTSEGHAFRATRDGEVLHDAPLEPEWSAYHGEKGCYRHELGTVTATF